MSYKHLAIMAGLMLSVAGFGISQRMDVIQSQQATADSSGNSQITVTCTGTTESAHVPESVAIAISFVTSAGTDPDVTLYAPGVSLGTPVNGDTWSDADVMAPVYHAASRSFVDVGYLTPIMKLAGLQCSGTPTVALAAYGDGDLLAPDALDVSYDNPSAGSSVFSGTYQIDSLDGSDTSSKRYLYGTVLGNAGTLSAAGIEDGNDYDTDVNGEVAFGGSATATGGSKTQTRFELGLRNSQSEGITWEFFVNPQ